MQSLSEAAKACLRTHLDELGIQPTHMRAIPDLPAQILEYKLEVERLKEENKSRKGTSESVPIDKREWDAAADVKTHSDAKTLPEVRKYLFRCI